MKNYLVFQVGCIECGVSSYVISTEESLQEAKEVADKHPSTWTSEGGDGYVGVYDLASKEEVYT
ncbi:MAG: hypothetical protein GY861_13570, partial [bacterium]|nr:hypothetical protein [bacterium]